MSSPIGSDVVEAFRLIGNWDLRRTGGVLVAEPGLQIMMVLDHPSSNDLLSLLLVLDG